MATTHRVILLLVLSIAQADATPAGPLPPPPNGTILAQFCDGHYNGKCVGGMGNWWSPTIATINNTLVVGALGKSSTSPLHETPTFFTVWRSTDAGATFGAPVHAIPETGSVIIGGATAVYSTDSETLQLIYTNCSNNSLLSVLSSTQSGEAGSWLADGLAHGAHGNGFASTGQVNSGLQLVHGPHKGRLVVPREIFLNGQTFVVGVVYSDDDAKTWTNGTLLPAALALGESAIAELTNGSIVLTARVNAAGQCADDNVCRMFAHSEDGGLTWSRVQHVPYNMLPAPRCEAAMTSVDLPGHPIGLLIFGAPMNRTTQDRSNYTVFTSLDAGQTWQWATGLYTSTPAATGAATVAWAGYSAITTLGTPQQVSATSWRVDIGAAFQLGHGLGGNVEGGGLDMAWARASIVVDV